MQLDVLRIGEGSLFGGGDIAGHFSFGGRLEGIALLEVDQTHCVVSPRGGGRGISWRREGKEEWVRRVRLGREGVRESSERERPSGREERRGRERNRQACTRSYSRTTGVTEEE